MWSFFQRTKTIKQIPVQSVSHLELIDKDGTKFTYIGDIRLVWQEDKETLKVFFPKQKIGDLKEC